MKYSTAYRTLTALQWALACWCAYMALRADSALMFWPWWFMGWWNGYFAQR